MNLSQMTSLSGAFSLENCVSEGFICKAKSLWTHIFSFAQAMLIHTPNRVTKHQTESCSPTLSHSRSPSVIHHLLGSHRHSDTYTKQSLALPLCHSRSPSVSHRLLGSHRHSARLQLSKK
ncbi:uncharacterized protein LOC114269955 isoform X3 [Camellia sinensis]|uniref:uncharacterized protein LOC114269955 isoform X3 n=2 Tax=Camellia sinensis TaxID=4442 RepID=UPI0010369CAD|nr:uncharacterized protein LOC114269955 isoform X3 [Camellia sinensis]